MEDNKFGILIDDGSELPITDDYITSMNTQLTELYDWQIRAKEFFFERKKVIYEVTTGAGKTFLAIELIKEILQKNSNAKFLIVVPKNVILETGWIKELYENGLTMVDVGVYYGFTKEYGKKITITNMQNLHNIATEVFDCIILDEIHNYGTKRLLKLLQKHNFEYMIGLSATLERTDKSHWELLKMFNYNKFVYGPKQALDEGILNPFNFGNIGVDMDDESYENYLDLTQQLNLILQIGGGFTKLMSSNNVMKFKMLSLMNERKQLVNNYPRKFEVVKWLCKKHKDDKMLIFTQFNKTSNALYWQLLDVGLTARIMHSGISKEEREKNLIDFRNDKARVLVATKVLDEGYNVKAVDTAIIMAADSSPRQTVQRLGRILRRNLNKKVSDLYLIYCKGTIEETDNSEKRRFFTSLCTEYKEYNYNGKNISEVGKNI